MARGHLGCAAGFPDSVLRGESAIAAAGVTGRLALTLSRYLADIAPYGMAEAITNRSLRPRIGAAVDAREALRVTCDLSRLLLETLAGRPGLFTGMPQVALQLRAAGETAAGACARWREVAPAWNDITTETRGLTAPGIPDPGDLIVGLGRLAFTDPQWTPARIRHSPPRDPAKLAPGPAQFTAVVSAVHHAVSAVVSIAATDRRAVDVAVRASRLHVPTRTLPDGYDVPRKFASALPSTTAALLAAYQAAAAASDLAVAGLDRLAVTVGAPSRILGLARAAARLGPDTTAALTADASATRTGRERNAQAGREGNAQAGREGNAHAGRGTGQGGYGASA